jgi:hypothetical protein
MKEELIRRAQELIEERKAEALSVSGGERISVLGTVISAEDGSAGQEDPREMEWNYMAQIQVQGSRVRVVPFCFEPYSSAYWSDDVYEEAQLDGQSLYSAIRPSLTRRSGGGALYLERTYSLYEDSGVIYAELISHDIIQQGLNEPFPSSPGLVRRDLGSGAATEYIVENAVSKSYHFLGAYSGEGRVYSGYHYSLDAVQSMTDPFDGGTYPRLLPYLSFLVPFNYSYTFTPP